MTTINTIDELIENIEYFNENNNLTHGNAEVFGQRNGDYYIYSVIEGTNHTTLTIMFDEKEISDMLNGQFINTLKTDTPRSFIEILEEDKAHFEELTFEISA